MATLKENASCLCNLERVKMCVCACACERAREREVVWSVSQTRLGGPQSEEEAKDCC